MEAEQRKEWYGLEREAIERLRRSNTPDRAGVGRVFQILVLPSFEAAVGWEVCRDAKADELYFVVHSTWRSSDDLAKLETPVVRLRHPRPLAPTIEVQQYVLDTNWAEATIAALQSVVIPAMVTLDRVGCDGTFYEVAFDELFASARYRWWEEPPAGWQALNGWLHETVDVLEQLTEHRG